MPVPASVSVKAVPVTASMFSLVPERVSVLPPVMLLVNVLLAVCDRVPVSVRS